MPGPLALVGSGEYTDAMLDVDRLLLGWVPDIARRALLRQIDGVTTIGIDEDTGLVGGTERFTVHGRQSVWLLGDGRRQQLRGGAEVTFPVG